MKQITRFPYHLVLGCFSLFSCATPEPGPVIDITVVPAHFDVVDPDLRKQKIRLQDLIDGHPDWAKHSESLQTALAGKEKMSLKQWDLAQELWLKLLKMEEQSLGRLAFHGWIDAYGNILGRQVSPEILARLLLAETNEGVSSPYLKAQGLDKEARLILAIAEHMGMVQDQNLNSAIIDFSKEAISQDDPLFRKLSESYCKLESKGLEPWVSWLRRLTPGQKLYWQALIAECEGSTDGVIGYLEKALLEFPKEKGMEGFAVDSAMRLVNAYRSIGDREAMAKTFVHLTRFYEIDSLDAKMLGQDEFDFEYDRVNQIIWSARYQALLGDYLTAKDHIQRAFGWLERSYPIAQSKSQVQKLDGLRAEAYHVLAYRISYEQGDFDAAIAQTLLGLEKAKQLSAWVTRFKWYAGWYEYRAGRFANAISYWQQLQTYEPAQSIRSQLLFWIADAFHRLNIAQKRDLYVKELCETEPLSFYALVGLEASRWNGPDCKAIGLSLKVPTNASKQDLLRQYPFSLDSLRRSKAVASYLYKAELALKANLPDLDRLTSQDLYRQLVKNIRPSKENDAYIYASRLMHGADLYHLGIGLSYDAALARPEVWNEYVDQLQVYFPRPYESMVKRIAARFHIDPSLVFGIGRQESAFRADAISPAGAMGLLQLMPATAKRFEQTLNSQKREANFDLFDPETNLTLGSAYLGKLSAHYESQAPFLIAAYNAGEFVVDVWKSRRYHEDLLVWIEGIPFGETRNYVKSVMRNKAVYDSLMR